jgi:hypothetical protein
MVLAADLRQVAVPDLEGAEGRKNSAVPSTSRGEAQRTGTHA